MNKKLLKHAICFLMLAVMAAPILSVSALDETDYGIGAGGEASKINVPQPTNPDTALTDTVVKVINIVLGLLGLIAVIIILIGGFEWMTAGGDDAKTKHAKDRMIQGLIGLVIIFLAYAIASFVISKLSSELV
jgi:type IV secretory pathway VirB2 component (pilin)